MNIIVYYLRSNNYLLHKIYNELPNCHKRKEWCFIAFFTSIERKVIAYYNLEKVKDIYVDVVKEIQNIIKNEIIENIKDEYLNNSVELTKITVNSIFNLTKQLSSFLNLSSSSNSKKNFVIKLKI